MSPWSQYRRLSEVSSPVDGDYYMYVSGWTSHLVFVLRLPAAHRQVILGSIVADPI